MRLYFYTTSGDIRTFYSEEKICPREKSFFKDKLGTDKTLSLFDDNFFVLFRKKAFASFMLNQRSTINYPVEVTIDVDLSDDIYQVIDKNFKVIPKTLANFDNTDIGIILEKAIHTQNIISIYTYGNKFAQLAVDDVYINNCIINSKANIKKPKSNIDEQKLFAIDYSSEQSNNYKYEHLLGALTFLSYFEEKKSFNDLFYNLIGKHNNMSYVDYCLDYGITYNKTNDKMSYIYSNFREKLKYYISNEEALENKYIKNCDEYNYALLYNAFFKVVDNLSFYDLSKVLKEDLIYDISKEFNKNFNDSFGNIQNFFKRINEFLLVDFNTFFEKSKFKKVEYKPATALVFVLDSYKDDIDDFFKKIDYYELDDEVILTSLFLYGFINGVRKTGYDVRSRLCYSFYWCNELEKMYKCENKQKSFLNLIEKDKFLKSNKLSFDDENSCFFKNSELNPLNIDRKIIDFAKFVYKADENVSKNAFANIKNKVEELQSKYKTFEAFANYIKENNILIEEFDNNCMAHQKNEKLGKTKKKKAKKDETNTEKYEQTHLIL